MSKSSKNQKTVISNLVRCLIAAHLHANEPLSPGLLLLIERIKQETAPDSTTEGGSSRGMSSKHHTKDDGITLVASAHSCDKEVPAWMIEGMERPFDPCNDLYKTFKMATQPSQEIKWQMEDSKVTTIPKQETSPCDTAWRMPGSSVIPLRDYYRNLVAQLATDINKRCKLHLVPDDYYTCNEVLLETVAGLPTKPLGDLRFYCEETPLFMCNSLGMMWANCSHLAPNRVDPPTSKSLSAHLLLFLSVIKQCVELAICNPSTGWGTPIYVIEVPAHRNNQPKGL